MQIATGCKINVSQQNGPHEVDREIGLVGSKESIEQAKSAIEEKVEIVVGVVLSHNSNLVLANLSPATWSTWLTGRPIRRACISKPSVLYQRPGSSTQYPGK